MATLTVHTKDAEVMDFRDRYTKAKNNVERILIFGELLQHASQLESNLRKLRDKYSKPTTDYEEACRIAGVSNGDGPKEIAC